MDSTASTLFGKTRRTVLALLFGQPERGFYLRELSRITGISPGALQHELGQLTKADLIERIRDGNRVCFKANSTHPVFRDLQALVQKTCGTPFLLRKALKPLEQKITFAAIYGSVAKGTDHARSDVDLIIVGSLDLDQATEAVAPVEEKIDRQISLRLFSEKEFGQRIRKKDSFLVSVMSGSPITLLGEPPVA